MKREQQANLLCTFTDVCVDFDEMYKLNKKLEIPSLGYTIAYKQGYYIKERCKYSTYAFVRNMHPDSYISILKAFLVYKIPIQILIKLVAKISYRLCNDGIGRVISNTTWVICPFEASRFNSYVSRFSPGSSPAVLDDPMSIRIMIANG